MSDLKLFRLGSARVSEIRSRAADLEKSLQTLLEANLETILGVRFLATEHVTGKTHGGRIDTLGIDENGCPVIIEYKRAINENVINQGLFYLDWLLIIVLSSSCLSFVGLARPSVTTSIGPGPDFSASRPTSPATMFTPSSKLTATLNSFVIADSARSCWR